MYVDMAFERAVDRKGRAGICVSRMSCYLQQDSIETALEVGLVCDTLIQSLEDEWYRHNLLAILYYNLGVVYNQKGQFAQSLSAYKKMEKVCEEGELERYYGPLYSDMAILYTYLKDYEMALEYFNKARKSLPSDYVLGHNIIDLNMAGLFFDRGQLDSSMFYYERVSRAAVSERQKVESLLGLIQVYIAEGQFEKARSALSEVLSFPTALSNPLFHANALRFLAETDMKKGSYKAALDEIEEALSLYSGAKAGYMEKQAIEVYFKILAAYYGDSFIYTHFAKYQEIADSLNGEEFKRMMMEEKERYRSRIKSDSIQMLLVREQNMRESVRRERRLKYVSWLVVVLLASLAYMLYSRFRSQKRFSLLLAEKNAHLSRLNERLISDVEAYRKRLKSPEALQSSFLELEDKARTKIQLGSIVYIEAKDGRVYIYTSDGRTITTWQTLKVFTELLPEELFVRIHRAFLINLRHLKEKKGRTLVMSDGTVLSVSRSYLRAVDELLEKAGAHFV